MLGEKNSIVKFLLKIIIFIAKCQLWMAGENIQGSGRDSFTSTSHAGNPGFNPGGGLIRLTPMAGEAITN